MEELVQEYNEQFEPYFEITDVVIFGVYGNIGRLAHPIRHVKPFEQIAVLSDAEYGRRHRVDGNDMALFVDSQPGDNVYVPNT